MHAFFFAQIPGVFFLYYISLHLVQFARYPMSSLCESPLKGTSERTHDASPGAHTNSPRLSNAGYRIQHVPLPAVERARIKHMVQAAVFSVAHQYCVALLNITCDDKGMENTPIPVIAGAMALQTYLLPELRRGAIPTVDIDLHLYCPRTEAFDAFCQEIVEQIELYMGCAFDDIYGVTAFTRDRCIPDNVHVVSMRHFCIDVQGERIVDILHVTPRVQQRLFLAPKACPPDFMCPGRECSNGPHRQETAAEKGRYTKTWHHARLSGPNAQQHFREESMWTVFVESLYVLCRGLWKTVDNVKCYRRAKDESRRRLLACLCFEGYMAETPILMANHYVAGPGDVGLNLDMLAQGVGPLPPHRRADWRMWMRPSEIQTTQGRMHRLMKCVADAVSELESKMMFTLYQIDMKYKKEIEKRDRVCKRLLALCEFYRKQREKAPIDEIKRL